MPLFRRSDGDLVKDEGFTRRTMLHLMPKRRDALVLFEQHVDVTKVLAYLERTNAAAPDKKITFFDIALCGMARAVGMRPQMNRFVSGRRIYQRKKIEFSFAVKKKLRDDAVMTVVKLPFHADDTIASVHDRIEEAINRGRGDELTASEREMRLATKLPAPILRFGMWLLRQLDDINLMPAKMIEADELYTSIFIANIGSVGLEAPYHHLYEWGTAPLFGVIGKISKQPVVNEAGEVVVRDMVTFRWSFDERIADGYYCARGLDLFKSFMADPEILDRKPEPRSSSPDQDNPLQLPQTAA